MRRITFILALIGLTTFYTHAQWVQLTDNVLPIHGGTLFNNLQEFDGTLYLSHLSGVRTSTDGTNWTEISNGLATLDEANNVYEVLAEGDILYAATLDGIFVSTDGGNNWTKKSNGITVGSGHANIVARFILKHNDILFTATSSGIYYSTDGAETWVLSKFDQQVKGFEEHNGALFVASTSHSSYLYKTLDNGLTWENVEFQYPIADILSFNGKLILASLGLYLSDDNGLTWDARTSCFEGNGCVPMRKVVGIDNKLYVPFRGTILTSDEEAWEWEDIGRPYGLNGGNNIIKFNNKLLVQSGNIWERSLDEVVSVNEINTNKQSPFTLSNYPNPFNAATTISVTLPKESDVNIDVYNVLGKKVAQVAQERLQEGDHRIAWDNVNLNAGTYFLELRVNGKRMNTTKCVIR